MIRRRHMHTFRLDAEEEARFRDLMARARQWEWSELVRLALRELERKLDDLDRERLDAMKQKKTPVGLVRRRVSVERKEAARKKLA